MSFSQKMEINMKQIKISLSFIYGVLNKPVIEVNIFN